MKNLSSIASINKFANSTFWNYYFNKIIIKSPYFFKFNVSYFRMWFKQPRAFYPSTLKNITFFRKNYLFYPSQKVFPKKFIWYLTSYLNSKFNLSLRRYWSIRRDVLSFSSKRELLWRKEKRRLKVLKYFKLFAIRFRAYFHKVDGYSTDIRKFFRDQIKNYGEVIFTYPLDWSSKANIHYIKSPAAICKAAYLKAYNKLKTYMRNYFLKYRKMFNRYNFILSKRAALISRDSKFKRLKKVMQLKKNKWLYNVRKQGFRMVMDWAKIEKQWKKHYKWKFKQFRRFKGSLKLYNQYKFNHYFYRKALWRKDYPVMCEHL